MTNNHFFRNISNMNEPRYYVEYSHFYKMFYVFDSNQYTDIFDEENNHLAVSSWSSIEDANEDCKSRNS